MHDSLIAKVNAYGVDRGPLRFYILILETENKGLNQRSNNGPRF